MPRWVLVVGLLFVGACNKSEPEETADPVEDRDEDGFAAGEDCDDADANVHPDAPELCNDLDDDCDTEIDEDVGDTFYTDGDGDGFGDDAAPVTACQISAGLAAVPGDCDDTDDAINPNASESCNDLDDDCDTQIDEDASDVWYADGDGDGYGDPATSVTGCPEEGYVADGTDCDDLNGDVNPAADEICNGEDDDCNDVTDDNPVSGGDTWYADTDGDGYGDPLAPITACTQPSGTVDNTDDCDDTSDLAQPGGTEVCDGYDNDCNGISDGEDAEDATVWYYDADGDGYGTDSRRVTDCAAPSAAYVGTGGDCDDADATKNPGVSWYNDADGDGYGDPSASLKSCTQPSGYVADASDCADSDSARNPLATEYCDGEDDDCDGSVDDSAADATTYYRDADGDGYGTSATTYKACSKPSGYATTSTDCLDLDATAYPGATEYCDSVDDDCDGTVDDSAADASTWYKDADGDGYGSSSGGTTTACTKPTGYAATNDDCNDASATYSPATVWYYDSDGDGYGDAAATKTQCASPGSKWVLTSGDCRTTDATSYPGAAETCFSGSSYEGYDNDCDGSVDEGCPTLHCGTISADEVWTAGSEHYVGCTVYVEGATVPILTIEDGATVYFNTGAGLYVGQSAYGDIVVNGTSSGVTFTSYKASPAPGDWYGIYFGQYSAGSVMQGLTIEYAQYYGVNAYNSFFEMYDSTIRDTLQYGMYLQGTDAVLDNVTIEGSGTYGLYLYDTAAEITNSTFQDNGSYGLYCSYGSCFGTSFTGNTLTGNNYPIGVPVDVIPMLSSTSTYSGNTNDYIEIGYANITTSATWQGLDVPYRVTSYIYVDGSTGPILTLQDGVTLQMNTSTALYIGCCTGTYKGDLVVNGSTKGVTITSSSSTPSPGSYYFQINNATSATKITGLTVEYGYYGIYIGTDAAITIDKLTSRYNQYYGLYFYSYTSSARTNDLTLTNSTFTDPGQYGVYFYGDALSITDTDVDGATSSGVYAGSKSLTFKNNLITGTTGATNYAMSLNSETSITSWSANSITGNEGYPLALSDAALMYKLDAASTYSGNGSDYVYVSDSSLDTSGTIPAIDATWWWPYGMQIYKSGSTVPVVYATGSDFLIGYNASYPYYQVYVYDGEFYASSCSFTGYGSSSAPRWSGIYYGNSTSTKGYVTGSDIGYGGYSGYNLYLGHKGITATSNYVHHSSGYGVQCSGGCTAGGYTLTGNSYASNTSGNTY
jgi:hypothetical protein